MRRTDVLCGTCTCGRDFEVPASLHPDPQYHCPHCGVTLLIEWGALKVELEPPPRTISDEENLK